MSDRAPERRFLVAEVLDDQDEREPLAPDAAPAPFLTRAAARAFLSPTRSALLERLLDAVLGS